MNALATKNGHVSTQVNREKRLEHLEQIVEDGYTRFVEVGLALEEIRAQGLYKEAGFKDFGAYCRERWGMGRNYARKLIAASRVAGVIASTMSTTVQAANERQCREMAGLNPDEIEEVWTEAAKDGEPTAEDVRRVVASKLHRKASDATGKLPTDDKKRVLREESDHLVDSQLAREKRTGMRRWVEKCEAAMRRAQKYHKKLGEIADLDLRETDERLEDCIAAVRREAQAVEKAIRVYLTCIRDARKKKRRSA